MRMLHYNNLKIYISTAIPAFLLCALSMIGCTPVLTPTQQTTPALSEQPTIPLSAEKVYKGPTTKKRVALTYDMEKFDPATDKLLQILRLNNVQSTFFILGTFVLESPKELQKIVQEGHEIGNHSWSHSLFTKISDKAVLDDITKLEQAVFDKTGVSTKPLLRAPYGESTESQRKLFTTLGYREIYWTIDTNDWKDTMSAQKLMQEVLKKVKPGSIILMHNIGDYTVESTATLIPALQQQGYQIVPVSWLFE